MAQILQNLTPIVSANYSTKTDDNKNFHHKP